MPSELGRWELSRVCLAEIEGTYEVRARHTAAVCQRHLMRTEPGVVRWSGGSAAAGGACGPAPMLTAEK